MTSCNPLGELSRTDDAYCFNAPNSTNGVCAIAVDQIDDDNSANGFGGGSHTGTTYTNGVLTLNATTNNAELDESWTPKWGNLVAYWKMDGDYTDSSGNNKTLTANGGATTSNAEFKVGSESGFFDGSNDFLSRADDDDFDFGTNPFSIGFWAKYGDQAGGTRVYANLLQKQNGFTDPGIVISAMNPAVSNSKGLRFQVTTDSLNSNNQSLDDNTWKYYTFVRTSTQLQIYINGVLDNASNVAATNTSNSETMRIGMHPANIQEFEGYLDDFTIWSDALSSDEIALIYSRQSAKYSGEMRSRIIDSKSTASSWTNLDWMTTLPFGKELPDGGGTANSESSADYSSLSNDTLMDELAGLWHLNESAGSLVDSSGNTNNGVSTGGTYGSEGIFDKSFYFDGNDFVTIASDASLPSNPVAGMTISVWLRLNTTSTSSTFDTTNPQYILLKAAGSINNMEYGFRIIGGRLNFLWRDSTDTSFNDKAMDSHIVVGGRWQHIVVKHTQTDVVFFVDGVERPSSIVLGSMINQNSESGGSINVGSQLGGSRFLNGRMDELAIWNRPLHDDEILQLYRRGANRIKYQVRSCASYDCSDQDLEEGFGWKGPGGNYLTYFSELYNNSSIASNCVIPQKCFAPELSLDGDVLTESPSTYFNDFGADGMTFSNNRYFQYRVIMESDDVNTSCVGATTCMPELKSVEIGPAHSY